MKPLPLALAAVAAAVVAALLMLMEEPSGKPDVVDRPDAPHSELGARAPLRTELATDERHALESLPAPVTLPKASSLEQDPTPASYRAALGGIIGRVVEAHGGAVPDLPLELLGGGLESVLPPLDAIVRGESPELAVELGSTLTDSEGRFRFEGLEPRMLGLLVLDPGGPRAMLHMLDESPVSGATRDLGDIVLPATVTLSGRVIDAERRPLPGVRVRATDLPAIVLGSGVADWRADSALLIDDDQGNHQLQMVLEPPPSLARLERLLPFPTTHSDDEGRFTLDGVRPGFISLVLDDATHQTRVEGPMGTGEAGSVRDLGDLSLADGLTLGGRVLTEDGEPVPGAQVRVGNQLSIAPGAILHGPIVADAEGRFLAVGLREGPARAVARSAAHHVYVADPGGAYAGGQITVVLPSLRTLTLELLDEAGEPVLNARVFARLLPIEYAESLPDFLLPPTGRGAEQGLTQDEQGHLLMGDLAPGLWDILIAAEGYGPVRQKHDLTLGDVQHTQVLLLARGLALRVVSSADGSPVEHAYVSARDVKDGRRGMPQPVTAGRTDAEGRLLLADLAASSYSLQVAHPRYAVHSMELELPLPEPQPGSPDDGALLIELSTGGTIVGSVIDNGAAPAEQLMLTLFRRDGLESAAAIPRMTLMAQDGSFSFHDVDPGEVRIEARPRVELASLTSFWEPFAMTPHARQELFIESDQEVEVTLMVGSTWSDIPTGFVEGRLTLNGFPAAGWKVHTWGKIRRAVTTGPDGHFSMGQLAAEDDVSLLFSAPGGSMTDGVVDTRTFTLIEGAREFVNADLSTGSVSGQVRSQLNGRPIEGVAVSLQNTDQENARRWRSQRGGTAVSDADGSFHFAIVSEGSYALHAKAEGYASTFTEAFAVTGLRELSGVLIELSEPIVFSGKVVLEGLDETPSWLFLNASNARGESSGTRADVETGSFTFDDLPADRNWTLECYTNTGAELQPIEVYLRGDRHDELLIFRPIEEVEPEIESPIAEEPKALGGGG
ncbi:MAG: hypothetical protein DRQ55_10495 [Planctomycetota bacterium]|nr:MAG: hypothetical protein DRQ55_10495 [Planctomycetota bacterium]